MTYRVVEPTPYRMVDHAVLTPSAKTDGPSPLMTVLDVAGGLIFATVVAFFTIRFGIGLYIGHGWGASIGFESVWMIVVLLCSQVMPSGIQHTISWKSTLRGIGLDWPELVMAVYILYQMLQEPVTNGVIKPLGFALSVGTGEEFLFRVLILGWLVTKVDAQKALLISSVVFGCAHLHEISAVGFMSVVPQFSGGMVLGAIYLRTRNPLGGILCHAFWDFPFFLAMGNGVSGGGTEAGMPSVGFVAFWMIFATYGLWLVRGSRVIELQGPETDNAKLFGY